MTRWLDGSMPDGPTLFDFRCIDIVESMDR